jgi:tetratricopeptide (TPR) repeat protein
MGSQTMIRNFLYYTLFVLLVSCLLCSLTASPDADYQEAMKALKANDYSNALKYLEAAVTQDPDNIRYASEYRQVAVKRKEFDRSVAFFEKLSSSKPQSANVHLNFGFAYVDKIPVAGSITQVILANKALNEFSKAVELQGNWINYYTRGASYLFWPKIFNRAPLGVADLEQGLKIQSVGPRRPYHVKLYISLGDGYWKTDQLEKARATWREGLKQFPDNQALKTRLEQQGAELQATIEAGFDPNKRVDTDLRDLWANSQN